MQHGTVEIDQPGFEIVWSITATTFSFHKTSVAIVKEPASVLFKCVERDVSKL